MYDQADKVVQAIMEISYCCAARIPDVLSITREQLREEGLYIKQGKTGKAQIKAFSPRLKRALDQAKAVQKNWIFGIFFGNNRKQVEREEEKARK